MLAFRFGIEAAALRFFQAELHEPVIQQRKAVDEKVVTLTAKPAIPHHQVVDDVTW
ncbi:hypothetical protein D9M70_478810 [compost metagenome]